MTRKTRVAMMVGGTRVGTERSRRRKVGLRPQPRWHLTVEPRKGRAMLEERPRTGG